MWASVNTISIPDTPAEAVKLAQSKDAVLCAGGTYLVSERKSTIRHLVDINHLVGKDIEKSDEQLCIGAGTPLQEIVKYFSGDDSWYLAKAAQYACPSKNIRNQRTLGGEIIVGRPDSEIVVLFNALQYEPDFVEDTLLTQIQVDPSDISNVVVHRFAVIPSAPAFVIVAGVRRGQTIRITIGGETDRITAYTELKSNMGESRISKISEETGQLFRDNHIGSRTYKTQVIQVGIKRILEAI